MTIYFSEVFKKLRKEKNLTQEQMADILGVSSQAISRWECATTYPDITLLPVIAEFFDISIDELLGAEKTKAQKKIEEYDTSFKVAISKGHIDACIDLMRAAVKEFPNNYHFLNQLMYALFVSGDNTGNIEKWEENKKQYDGEIIDIGNRILNYCTDDEIRLEAKSRLAFHYADTNRTEKAKEIIATLPSEDSCREGVAYWTLEGREKEEYLQGRIESGVERLWFAITAYACHKEVEAEIKIKWLLKQVDVLDIIYEGQEYGEWYWNLSTLYARHLAKLYMSIGDVKNTLVCINKAAEYAIAFENLPQVYTYQGSLMEGAITDKGDCHTADTRTICELIYDEIFRDQTFETLRSEQSFLDDEEKLKACL